MRVEQPLHSDGGIVHLYWATVLKLEGGEYLSAYILHMEVCVNFILEVVL
jgi:hypothetical protein